MAPNTSDEGGQSHAFPSMVLLLVDVPDEESGKGVLLRQKVGKLG